MKLCVSLFSATLVFAGLATPCAADITLAPAVFTVLATNDLPGGPGATSGSLSLSTLYVDPNGTDSAQGVALSEGPANVIPQNSFPVYGPAAGAVASGEDFASGNVTYYFAITGPANIQIPISVSGFVYAALSNPPPSMVENSASASVDIWNPSTGFTLLDSEACVGSLCGSNVTFTDFSGPASVSANMVFEIQLGAEAFPDAADQYESLGTVASAIADPFIEIDPTFASANPGYSLVFSSGVNNVSSVPEPSSFGFFTLIIVILAMCRVRSKMSRRFARIEGRFCRARNSL